MPRKPPQQRYLQPSLIQSFGLAIVVAILAYGFATKNASIVLAVLGFAGACVMVGGYYERANHEVAEALDPASSEPPSPTASRETDR